MNSKHLKGLTVISIADGERLGTIDRVYLDPASKEVVGFSVRHGGGGLLAPADDAAPELIDVDDVHALGQDAVTLSSKGDMRGDQTRAMLDSLMELDDLIKLKTVTEGGTYVGDVASLELDDRGFRIRELEVSPGFFKSNRHVATGQVISIGHDLVVVADTVLAADTLDSDQTTIDPESGEGRFVVGDVTKSE